MKLMIASDIHGSALYCRELMEAWKREAADRMLILGDILYHGPRNPLPQDYNPQVVIKLLNSVKDKIIAVRGNCDSEVDQMVLEFPIMADYNIIPFKHRKIMASHGHIYDENKLPISLAQGDVFIFGHIHVPVLKQLEGIYILNPGSATLPKENHPNTYATLVGDHFKVKTFDGEVYKDLHLK